MKEKLYDYIDSIEKDLNGMAEFIFNHPELSFNEIQSANYICDFLEDNGFQVERGVGGLETSFRAVYKNLDGGPSIGLLTEYDALEGIGHACGHHLQPSSIIGAALAVKNLYTDKPFRLIVYGTPAEEGGGGKIIMLKNGAFKDIDVAIMMHGGPETTTDVKSLASTNFEVTFHGISAHAALKPEQGRSSLDAVLLMFNGIEFMREHVPDDVRMHYTIKEVGGPANVVPKKSVATVSLRSYNRTQLDDVILRAENIFKGAALMTGTNCEYKIVRAYNNKIPVLSLNELLLQNAEAINAPNITPPRQKTGSTDFGNVMFELPGSCIRVAFVPPGTSSHSQTFIDYALSEEAYAAIKYGAKIIAGSVVDMIENEEILKNIQNEFKENKEKAKSLV